MSADDALNGQQFFHASSAKFKRGDLIVPKSDPSHPDHHRYEWDQVEDDPDAGDLHTVFVAHRPEFAEGYGQYTYKVTPTGETHSDSRWPRESRFTHSPVRVVGLHHNRGY